MYSVEPVRDMSNYQSNNFTQSVSLRVGIHVVSEAQPEKSCCEKRSAGSFRGKTDVFKFIRRKLDVGDRPELHSHVETTSQKCRWKVTRRHTIHMPLIALIPVYMKLYRAYRALELYRPANPGRTFAVQNFETQTVVPMSGGGKESADHDDVPAWPRLVPGVCTWSHEIPEQ